MTPEPVHRPLAADAPAASPRTTDAGTTFAITGAHVVPIEGEPFDGTVLVREGRLCALGPELAVPAGVEVLEADGAWLLPGFVDAHVHLGVDEEGEGWAGDDTNEMTDPVMAAARAIDAVNPLDIGFDDAIIGGVTAVNVNPGSGNPIGGLAVALRTHGRVVDEMVLRSPSGLKAALGENPKRVYGERKQTPSTRLGVALTIRKAFAAARAWSAKPAEERDADLVSEALTAVLEREIPWRQHAHRADDIATALRLAEEFGYRLVLDHGTESHLIADRVAEAGVPVLYGPLIVSRSKVEVRHRTPAAPGLLAAAGVEVSIITDHPVVPIEFLVHQAALAVKHGMDPADALRALTLHPARVLGLEDRLGALAPGKDADLVLWEGDPLDVRNRSLRVWQGGREVMHRGADGEAVIAPR
ncbi:amidohydrolase [Brachybacterium saurashtrense]|uniref:Amidohydrolase n=1 Tax=Brachybacterium saurashtrense TaxID=556288 RepID=A0A345YNZ1_9MICO|nr:amidohydrolase [Brachybacterium saurashtrense]AXK45643.1 amidohydrolase [Brachybacterium saurashtrense]RRR24660.1 amidohydrolase [Brachybacterium saurashtrense]